MPAAVAYSVKCRPHHRCSAPQLPAALEILPRGAPASAGELRVTRCRTPPSLSFARASDQGEPPVPPTGARRPRDGPAPSSRGARKPAPPLPCPRPPCS
ncbi:hypothetical protein ZWY2020_025971 [Hordeum vulgare]|nr:hypothetical protein ZWY2020_025971 [Hordeum vulgare]